MGLFDNHVTDKEFSDWKRQHFTPLSTRLDSKADRSDVKAVEAKVEALKIQLAQSVGETDRRLAEKLRAISKETHQALDQLHKAVSEGIPKELKSICENQICEIEKRLKEFETLTGKMVNQASECRQLRDQVALQRSVASEAAERAKASEAEVTHLAETLVRNHHGQTTATIWGRLRWLICGNPSIQPGRQAIGTETAAK